MKNEYYIKLDTIQESITKLTKNIMKNQKNWKKDNNLDLIEFQLEGAIIAQLEKINGIKIV